MNYYKDLWTKPDSHGNKFFKSVDFEAKAYKYQEQVFWQALLSYRNLYGSPKSVLELGIGTGRMTKIMLDVFPDVRPYDALDINMNTEKIKKTLGRDLFGKLNGYNLNITSKEFDIWFNLDGWDPERRYDFILASEVFLHIKPSDIESVIKKCIKLLNPEGVILNIDWSHDPLAAPKEWCFIHPYGELYTENGLKPIFTSKMGTIKQTLYMYGVRE